MPSSFSAQEKRKFSMTKITDVIRFNISKLSDKIHDCKMSALNNPISVRRTVTVRGKDSIAHIESDRCTMVRHIAPAHPSWDLYRGLKHQVSVWLMVLQIDKASGFVADSKIMKHGSIDMVYEAYTSHTDLIIKLDKGWTPDGLQNWLTQQEEESRSRIMTRKPSVKEHVQDLALA